MWIDKLFKFSVIIFIFIILSGALSIGAKYYLGSNASETSNSNIQFTILVYSIALGIIGIFNMYNAFKIFEKKEQIDKEVSSRLDDLKDNINILVQKEQSIKFDYNKKVFEINQVKTQLENDLKSFKIDLMAFNDGNVKDIMAKVDNSDKFFRKKIEELVKEFSIHIEEISESIDRVHYSYILNTIMPHYLGTDINVKNVETALYWFGQHGTIADKSFLDERKNSLLGEDVIVNEIYKNELIKIFDQAVSEIRMRSSL
jgi:hypothetical protein